MAYLYDFKLIIIIIIVIFISISSSISQQDDSTKALCNQINCPFGQGQCLNNQCYCFTGYVTNTNEINSNNHLKTEKTQEKTITYCNYEVKSHTIAFFLEFFFPFGTGHFYSQRYINGCFKLMLFVFLCIFWCGDICGIRIRFALNSKMDKIHIVIVLLNLLTLFIVHIIDLICFGFQIYKDGNGVEMI